MTKNLFMVLRIAQPADVWQWVRAARHGAPQLAGGDGEGREADVWLDLRPRALQYTDELRGDAG